MFHSFYGGVHPPSMKRSTHRKPTRALPVPPRLIVPLSMHAGTPCRPLVTPGVKVLLGQVIGEAATPDDVPVHAPVSGTVAAIEPRPYPGKEDALCIVIDNDFLDEASSHIAPRADTDLLTRPELIELIREAGIVGLGGGGVPTHLKLRACLDRVDTLIINGTECEPFLTADHRLLLERPLEVLTGTSILMKILSLEHATLAIESNMYSAVDVLSKHLQSGSFPGIRLKVLRTQFPIGAEKQLIQALTGRQVPPGKRPSEVGCVVFNVDTAAAVFRAVEQGMPLIRRIVTVNGPAIRRPKNLRVRIGTPLQFLLDNTGAARRTPTLFVMGGPMTGVSVPDLSAPVVKTTTALLALDERSAASRAPSSCIYCGRCVAACPMRLMPMYLAAYAERGAYDKLFQLHLQDCIGCGACTYICPSRRPLVQAFRAAKAHLPTDEFHAEEAVRHAGE